MSTAHNALYKVRNSKIKARRNQVRRINKGEPGSKLWTFDGQGYRVHKDGSLRRIDEPAPDGLLSRVRGMFRA